MTRKPLNQVKVGDVLEFFGTTRRITEIVPYVGKNSDVLSSIAKSGDDWGISVDRDGLVFVDVV